MDGKGNLFLRIKRREIKLIEVQPLDIQPSDLYSSYAYDYPMVDLQKSLFRYLPETEESTISPKDFAIQPLAQGAKQKNYRRSLNNKCPDCGQLILNNSIRCASCRMIWLNKNNNPMYNKELKEKMQIGAILKRIDKYKDLVIDEDAHQILLGSLLGDGSLTIHKFSPRFSENHCMKQKEYLNWKINYFEKDNIPLTTRIVILKKNGKQINYQLWSMETKYIPQLLYYYSLFYGNGKKEVNWKILQQLEPLGLAVWYCDDGSLYKRNDRYNEVHIATNCFSLEQLELVKTWFKFRWDINITIRPSDNTISIMQDSIKKFINLIKPYIQSCMRYKININPIMDRYCKFCKKKLTKRINQKYCNVNCKYKYYSWRDNNVKSNF